MSDDSTIGQVLAAYPAECQPTSLAPLSEAGGFSGARLWRLETPRGPACLRRWPAEHPRVDQLQFIQAVLWHVEREGFTLVPVPWETVRHAGFVSVAGHHWELAPWLPGAADYRARPAPARLRAALAALAEFHVAAESFPLPSDEPVVSPGIVQRREQIERWRAGAVDALMTELASGRWPDLARRGPLLVESFRRAAAGVAALLAEAAQVLIPLQPAIRDIWHEHVLFLGDEVSGLVDFGALRPESVAADLARLLGSLARDDAEHWERGLAAYQRVRKLSDGERRLVRAFDASAVLLSGMQWLEWIVLQGRRFPRWPAVLERIDENLARLTKLAGP